METLNFGQHLIADPRVCHGQLTFKGTRVPVDTVLQFLSEGDSVEKILESWPHLKREAISEAIRLAADALLDGVRTRLEASPRKKILPAKSRKRAI